MQMRVELGTSQKMGCRGTGAIPEGGIEGNGEPPGTQEMGWRERGGPQKVGERGTGAPWGMGWEGVQGCREGTPGDGMVEDERIPGDGKVRGDPRGWNGEDEVDPKGWRRDGRTKMLMGPGQRGLQEAEGMVGPEQREKRAPQPSSPAQGSGR